MTTLPLRLNFSLFGWPWLLISNLRRQFRRMWHVSVMMAHRFVLPLLTWNTRATFKVAVSQLMRNINIRSGMEFSILVRSIHFNMTMAHKICQKIMILQLLVSQIPFPVGDVSVPNPWHFNEIKVEIINSIYLFPVKQINSYRLIIQIWPPRSSSSKSILDKNCLFHNSTGDGF